MNVVFSKDAQKQLEKLPKAEAKKVVRKIEQLEQFPYSAKKLSGKLEEVYSLRAWPYRIIYQIYPRDENILILQVEHRQGVYK